ncbi:malto-oligosyltrehalose trehalohydrolase [Variovorax guangxiensis]|uniref:Malto-oligosyltrehalose trehalohydrolase n=1 Tax=Variovorax guangxiensis TaxID=1775474 RepID=A0A433MED2_9BURK|nr:malto-oligosyltrehalose trehalohydrolase [Variovorax guangxiensis]RUR66279.1 malto-oligosyltrehalose trehalohydrolase [Variovorax guangxiensis]
MSTHAHTMPFGATAQAQGVDFALWAPSAEAVVLEHRAAASGCAAVTLPMERDAHGWHRLTVPKAGQGDSYGFRLPDGTRVPDPASRFNPEDVHGPSVVIDPRRFEWTDDAWRGRAWEEAVVYELHVGTFTDEGTFRAARQRLEELAELGITAIELMPLADFPGRRNWGYDGVLPFAPDASYGTPDDLKALIDAAHSMGLMVLLDVVYNHFGPEGNYLHACCPEFFNQGHQTPWGPAINFDGPASRTVRDFFIHNACYWIEEFRFDGLRMDAIHAIHDETRPHIVQEIRQALDDGPARGRHVHLVLENDANQASMLMRDGRGIPVAGTAQWNDDLHHAAHVLATGERDGYYADYAGDPVSSFACALAEGFVYQGQPSAFRHGERRGEPSTRLPQQAFVSFLQTHDQVGNRAFGERIHALGDPVLVRAAMACLLLSPHVPMFFMGDEFAASTPFLYFCDFGPELASAVAEGRRSEFGGFAAFADEAARARIPDPNAESTFLASKLRWRERGTRAHFERLCEVRQLLEIRHRLIVPRLAGMSAAGVYRCENGTLQVAWDLGAPGTRLHLLAHFGDGPVAGLAAPPGKTIHSEGAAVQEVAMRLERGAVHVMLEDPPGVV